MLENVTLQQEYRAGYMTINEFCGIAVVAMFVTAVTLFVVLIIKINRPPRLTLHEAVPALLCQLYHPREAVNSLHGHAWKAERLLGN
jgi:hypothetical protein